MPFGWVAAAGALSGVIGANASQEAAGTQAGASKEAANIQKGMFDTVSGQQLPWRQAGQSSLDLLGGYLGLPGYSANPSQGFTFNGVQFESKDAVRQWLLNDYQQQVSGRQGSRTDEQYKALGLDPANAVDPSSIPIPQAERDAAERLVATARPTPGAQPAGGGPDLTGSLLKPFTAADTYLAPNYKFNLEQGLGAVTNKFNQGGGLLSGNTARGMIDYATGRAADSYGQAFDIYNQQQTNIFNRLASISGLGQTAGSNATTGASGFATGIGNATANAGAAQASGTVGSANAVSGGLNNAASMFWLQNQTAKSPSTGGTVEGVG